MSDYTCRYPDGNVPQDLDSVAARVVTITIDPEDAVDIIRALREECCPNVLRTVGDAIAHAPGRAGR